VDIFGEGTDGAERERWTYLCNVGEDAVYHADQHTVPVWFQRERRCTSKPCSSSGKNTLERMSRILDYGDYVCALCGEADEVAAAAVGEFDGEDDATGADDVGDVRDRGAGCCAEVEDAGAGFHVDVVEATADRLARCIAFVDVGGA